MVCLLIFKLKFVKSLELYCLLRLFLVTSPLLLVHEHLSPLNKFVFVSVLPSCLRLVSLSAFFILLKTLREGTERIFFSSVTC